MSPTAPATGPAGSWTSPPLDTSPTAAKLRDSEDIDEEALLAEFEAEKPGSSGIQGHIVQVGGVALSPLYWVFNPMPKQVYLPTFLGVGLFLTFLTYRGWPRSKAKQSDKPEPQHPGLGAGSAVAGRPTRSDWQAFFRRAITPTLTMDLIIGTLLVLLVRGVSPHGRFLVRWSSWGFLAVAYFGSRMPSPFTTADFQWTRLIRRNVMGTRGIFGVPLDVAATYIILFTIYGAVLAASGAARFFIDLSFAAFKAAGPPPAAP